jgi:hypothetical protein
VTFGQEIRTFEPQKTEVFKGFFRRFLGIVAHAVAQMKIGFQKKGDIDTGDGIEEQLFLCQNV